MNSDTAPPPSTGGDAPPADAPLPTPAPQTSGDTDRAEAGPEDGGTLADGDADRGATDDSRANADGDTDPDAAPGTVPEDTAAAPGPATAPHAPAADAPSAADPFADPRWARHETAVARLAAEVPRLNDVIDRLHAENERLRRGEVEALIRPLLRDLVKMSDDWTATARHWQRRADAGDPATPADVAARCLEAADDAQLILQRHGVEPFTPRAGEPFDRRRHRAVGREQTTDEALDGTVAAVRRTGFTEADRVLRFAEVLVHAWRPDPESPAPESPAPESGDAAVSPAIDDPVRG